LNPSNTVSWSHQYTKDFHLLRRVGVIHQFDPDERCHAAENLEAAEMVLLLLTIIVHDQADDTEGECSEQDHVCEKVDDGPEALCLAQLVSTPQSCGKGERTMA
jgi:hypothetical protein